MSPEPSDRRAPVGLLLDVSLDAVARGARAQALTDHLRDAVRRGSLPTGTRLPASRTLAADLGVSRGVVVRAYEQLTAEGYLQAVQGRGTEVADIPAGSTDPVTQAPYPVTNPGLPSGAMFPRDAWLRSLSHALTTMPDAELSYGHPAGHPLLRDALSSYLGRVRALVAPADRIVITNGFAQTSRLVADVLTAHGIEEIGVEDPGSAGLREQLQRAGLRCRAIPVDRDGIRVDALAATGLTAVVVTPAHQFPTGAVLSARRRHELLSWGQSADRIIVEDDYDAEFRYDRHAVGSLQGLGPEHVIYGGSVSKILAPGLRLGWMVLPSRWVQPFVDAKYAADLTSNVIDQAALAHFIEGGQLDRHIRHAASAYRGRRDRLADALATSLPSWHVDGTAAGLHLLARPDDLGPADIDGERRMARLAQRCGLDARPLGTYYLDRPAQTGLVIGYGHQRADAIERAVTTLARSIIRGDASRPDQ